MFKRVMEFFIVDILIAINKIERYRMDITSAESFYYDEKSFDASMRELQIIGEATKHLINNNILDDKYRVIVDFRNLIVHEYFGIDADEIWDIITNELPQFQKTVLTLLKNSSDKKLVSKIIFYAKEDLKNRGKTVEFLETLETSL